MLYTYKMELELDWDLDSDIGMGWAASTVVALPPALRCGYFQIQFNSLCSMSIIWR